MSSQVARTNRPTKLSLTPPNQMEFASSLNGGNNAVLPTPPFETEDPMNSHNIAYPQTIPETVPSPIHSNSDSSKQSDDGVYGDTEVELNANSRNCQREKRLKQNREAQRAFRARRENYVKKLEDQVAELKAVHRSYNALTNDVSLLNDRVQRSETERKELAEERDKLIAENALLKNALRQTGLNMPSPSAATAPIQHSYESAAAPVPQTGYEHHYAASQRHQPQQQQQLEQPRFENWSTSRAVYEYPVEQCQHNARYAPYSCSRYRVQAVMETPRQLSAVHLPPPSSLFGNQEVQQSERPSLPRLMMPLEYSSS